ncbi:MAG TPA: hypothetical protein VJT72_21795 [Pseudonocardiaceae bacterium]|nr:hypothetical protein [Pseudonocardiaceae bacterium]
MTFGIVAAEKRAADLREGELDPRILDQHCISWGVGLLRYDACVDLSVLEADVSVYLAGVKIAKVVLNHEQLSVDVGGSVDGLKAVGKIRLELDPLLVVIDTELCVPVLRCKKYHVEIPLFPGEDVD